MSNGKSRLTDQDSNGSTSMTSEPEKPETTLIKVYTERLNKFKQDLYDGHRLIEEHERVANDLRSKVAHIEGAVALLEQMVAEQMKQRQGA